MINFIQSNQDVFKATDLTKKADNYFNIIDNDIWENITHKLKKKENIESLSKYIYEISLKYNIDKKNIIKDYLNYIISNYDNIVSNDFLNFVENLIHSQDNNNQTYLLYSLSKLLTFF